MQTFHVSIMMVAVRAHPLLCIVFASVTTLWHLGAAPALGAALVLRLVACEKRTQ